MKKEIPADSFLDPAKDSQTVKVNGCPLEFNHLSKVYWPEDGITKRDMFNYYDQIADYMVPYLKDRPMSLHRFPNGIHGPSFYQKNVKDKAPDCMATMPHTNEKGEAKEYLVATNKASLLWMASLGCIEIHPWFSRVQSPDHPDFCIIDLDPDKQHFDQVIEAAQKVREVCDAIGVPTYPKTSGSTGMHIYIPLGAKYTYDQSQMFAKIIVTLVQKQLPDYTTLERMVKNRGGKMYLDFLQNRPDATIAGVYSLRPKPGATVSMPVTWDEVKPGLTMRHFTIHNSIARLKETGDLFKGVLGTGIDLAKQFKKHKVYINSGGARMMGRPRNNRFNDVPYSRKMTAYRPPSAEALKVLETVPNMYLILSPDLFILTASDLYLEATECTRQAIIGKHIFEAFPDNPDLPDADGVQNINASLQEVLRTGKPHKMRIQRYDVPDIQHPGKFIQRYWDPSHTPVFDEAGEIAYIIQLATNVTEQVLKDQTHEKLQISERHFRHLADLVPAKISNALPNGEVTFFNQQWLDYSQLSFEELRDFGYHQMMHPDEIPEFKARLAAAADVGKPMEMEMRFRNAAGDYRWHLNIASPVLDENGGITMWVGSTTDIQRLKDEDQRKADFIGMVSHELKTPLTSLTAILQVLSNKLRNSDDPFISNGLENALRQVKKMSHMINGFLNVSRLESGKILIEKQPFLIGDLLRESIQEINLAGNSHSIELQSCVKIVVNADPHKIGSVISNLLSNAVKYSPKGTKITVNCAATDQDVLVGITDEGIGIRPEDRDRIFERFYRVKSHTPVSGFGIGLYLSAEIIGRHNGKIWVESEAGKGATFYFSLPLKTSQAS